MSYKALFWSAFEYYTPKIVHIKNRKIGVLNRTIQFSIIAYILCYVILWNKGYQKFSTIESSSVMKVKGVVYPNFTDDEFIPRARNIVHLYRRTWDVVDYAVPSTENNAFFIMTNVVITPEQEQGYCPEDPTVPGAICVDDSNCTKGHSYPTGNGVLTGKCVYRHDDNVTTCEILGWCPVERDSNPLKDNKALLAVTQNSTVLIKHYATFPVFGIRRRNIPDKGTHSLHCTYRDNKRCPIFILKDIVPGDYDQIAVKGGAVAIDIMWNCNFDYDPSRCFPTYAFRRLDSEYEIASGLNFRFAHYYNVTKRTLFKAYGIQFQIFTSGHGGKFNVVPLFLNIGSGVGLLAVTTVLCDIVVLYCVKKRAYYYRQKYQEVRNPDSRPPSVSKGTEIVECASNMSPAAVVPSTSH